jgi:hypothetical protein
VQPLSALAARRSTRNRIHMPETSVNTVSETRQQRFERILCAEPFKGLKAILDSLSRDRLALYNGVNGASSYEDLLVKLGYRFTVTKQVHLADCYSRTGPGGGIRSVLPHFDIPTQSPVHTVVNVDSTITATPKSAAFFNGLLAEFKRQLGS